MTDKPTRRKGPLENFFSPRMLKMMMDFKLPTETTFTKVPITRELVPGFLVKIGSKWVLIKDFGLSTRT